MWPGTSWSASAPRPPPSDAPMNSVGVKTPPDPPEPRVITVATIFARQIPSSAYQTTPRTRPAGWRGARCRRAGRARRRRSARRARRRRADAASPGGQLRGAARRGETSSARIQRRHDARRRCRAAGRAVRVGDGVRVGARAARGRSDAPPRNGRDRQRADDAGDHDGAERADREGAEHLLEGEEGAGEGRVERAGDPGGRAAADEDLEVARLEAERAPDAEPTRGAEHRDRPLAAAEPPEPSVTADATVRATTGRPRITPSRLATASCTSGTFCPSGDPGASHDEPRQPDADGRERDR